jgi:hypothetical protein
MSSYREVPIIAKRIISGSTAHPEPHLIREVDVINLNWGNLVLIGNDVYAYSGTLGDNTHEFELVGPWEGGGGEVQDEVDVMEETLQGEGGGDGDFDLLLPTIPPGDECFGLDLAHYASLPGQDFIVGGVEEDRAIGEGSEGEGGGEHGGGGGGAAMEVGDSGHEEVPMDFTFDEIVEDISRWRSDDYLSTLNDVLVKGEVGSKVIGLPGTFQVGFIHEEADIDGMAGLTTVVSEYHARFIRCFGAKMHGSIYPMIWRV